ncbi:hypothetical protein J2S78_001356 [Salibacterium salarium]|uniref:hypothetical protein n=1 Tax=Salibacterium salarium TaxID=284579 RepID=UPI0027812126|nr:hypothetical protein [Salibacterium salarium]MDQ0298936.1 hypothetical protein [Salibacterium salarium]
MASIEMAQQEILSEKRFEGLTENSLESSSGFFEVGMNGYKSKELLNAKGWSVKTFNGRLKLMRVFFKMAHGRGGDSGEFCR